MTSTDLIAAASATLEAGGYRQIRQGFADWLTPSTRLFEDKYNVVGIAVLSTYEELLRSWSDLQGSLVDVISRNVGQTERKAWDGYLVLLTPSLAPSNDLAVDEVRHDTTRLRKFVATGDDLVVALDVERLLRPLLPLREMKYSIEESSALNLLPRILSEYGVAEPTTNLLIRAYVKQEPLMDALHQQGSAL